MKNRFHSGQSLDELDVVCEKKLMTGDLGKVKSLMIFTEDYKEDEEGLKI